MQKRSIIVAATAILRRINKFSRTNPRVNTNECWNAATSAKGYATEGQITKAEARLVEARACARRMRLPR